MNCKICKQKLYLAPILIDGEFEEVYLHRQEDKKTIQDLVLSDISFWQNFKTKMGDICEENN